MGGLGVGAALEQHQTAGQVDDAITVPAGDTVHVKGVFSVSTGATPGIKIQLSGTDLTFHGMAKVWDGTTLVYKNNVWNDGTPALIVTTSGTALSHDVIEVDFVAVNAGASSSTVAIDFAQLVADASDTEFEVSSWVVSHTID